MTDAGAATPQKPLSGVRIVEISAYVAAPYAGQMLATLGADVIRVEPPGGQVDRHRLPLSPGGTSLYWNGLNGGKRSFAVDLRAEDGVRLVRDLILDSGPRGGVVLGNTAAPASLGYDALVADRPDLIHAWVRGTRSGRTAVDYTVQAEVGLHELIGPRDVAGPVNSVLPAWDLLCGTHLASAVLAAERHRLASGEGQRIEVALRDVALAAISALGFLGEAQLATDVRRRDGNYVYGTFGRDFTSRDGIGFMLVVLTARHWEALVELTGLDAVVAALESSTGTSLDDERERFRQRDVIAALLQTWFSTQDFADLGTRLDGARLVWSRYQSLEELVGPRGEALADDDLFSRISLPTGETYFAVGGPMTVNGHHQPARSAPLPGDATDILLAERVGAAGAGS